MRSLYFMPAIGLLFLAKTVCYSQSEPVDLRKTHIDSLNYFFTSIDTVYRNTNKYYLPIPVEVKKDAVFEFATFKKKSNLNYIKFDGLVDFEKAEFNRNINLSFDTFQSSLSFAFLKISDSCTLDFEGCYLPDEIDFSHVPLIKNEIDLSIANFNRSEKKHFIRLYKSDISKFHFDYSHFKLLITNNNNETISRDEVISIYEAVLKNFKDHGQMESYESCDIEYQNYKHGYFFIPYIWYCYGYKKWLVFVWTLLFITIFTVITFYRIERLSGNVYIIDNFPQLGSLSQLKDFIKTNKDDKINTKKKILDRWWYSFSYTATIFFLFWLKIEKLKFENKKGVLYIFVVYAVGLLCLGYIANFVIQK